MSERFEYYDEEWRTKVFECPDCGWSGTHEEMSGPHMFEELFDCRCKNCKNMLLIVSWPFPRQVREAAERGNEEAIRELDIQSGKGEAFEEFKREWEEANNRLRDSFVKFDGPKSLITADGYEYKFNQPLDNKDHPIAD